MTKIFFQGDSITDAHRNRSDNHNLAGYSQKVADYFGDAFEYVNYGCSGDTTRHMVARHEKEFAKEKADCLVMMAGINDVWRHYGDHLADAVSKEECISNIKEIINVSKKINPNVKVIFVEPYLVPGNIPALKNADEFFLTFLKLIRESIPSLVDKYLFTYEDFLDLTKKGDFISYDGVHPNENGEIKIAEKIISAIKELNLK